MRRNYRGNRARILRAIKPRAQRGGGFAPAPRRASRGGEHRNEPARPISPVDDRSAPPDERPRCYGRTTTIARYKAAASVRLFRTSSGKPPILRARSPAPATVRQRDGHLRAGRDRTRPRAGPQERRSHRPLHRRRRRRPLCRPRGDRPGRQGRADQCRAAGDGRVRSQSRRDSAQGLRRLPRRSDRQPGAVLPRSPERGSTASTPRAPRSARA